MKKLMMAVAIVCAVAMAHAAAFDWKTAKTGGAVNAPAGGSLIASTAYIFEASVASTVFDSFVAGKDWTVGALDSNSIAATGKMAAKTDKFIYGGEGQPASINAIFAFTEKIGDMDYLYISTESGEVSGEAVGAKTIQFVESGVSTTINDLAGGYKGAGWYSQSTPGPEPIPEPTSGLMLLLGMAGLALRRRRA